MFDMTPLPDGFTVEMGTDLDNVDRCVELMRAFLEERGAQEHLFAISLLTREAVNNAMIHGNRMDAGKRGRLRFLGGEEGLRGEVEDQGPGFAWQNHVQSRSGVDDVRGRGHEIYRNYASAIRYNERGNVLTLEYRGEA